MKHVWTIALACALSSAAQENPLRGDVEWAGTWSDSRVELVLKANPGGAYGGSLQTGGVSYPLMTSAQLEGFPKRLKGTFGPSAKEFPLTLLHEGDALVLRTGGNQFRLSRQGKTSSSLSAAPAKPKGPDLSHVKVGQRYVYAMQNNMESVWEVLELKGSEVRYSMTIYMDLGQGKQAVGEPTEQVWKFATPVETEPMPNAEQPKRELDSLEVSGVKFHALIVESDNGGMRTKSWVTISGPDLNAPMTFPGVLEAEVDGKSVMKLIRIE